jgi:hypothetical protein
MNGGNLECARRLGGQLPGMRCLGLVIGPGASSSVLLRVVHRRSFPGSPDRSGRCLPAIPVVREGPERSPLLALLDWFERVLRHACRVDRSEPAESGPAPIPRWTTG